MKCTILLTLMVFFCLPLTYGQAGQIDSSFGIYGIANTSITIKTVPIFQKDGKILVAGVTGDYPNTDFAIARFNYDGTPDKTFGEDGTQTTDFGKKNDDAISLALQSDGKILVGGNSHSSDTNDANEDSTVFSIARYNTDGSMDKTFSADGKVQQDFFNNGNNNAKSVVVQSDGKIVLIGAAIKTFSTYPFQQGNTVLVRYNSDGTLDKTFNGTGKQIVLFNFYSDEGGDDLEPTSSVIDGSIQPGDKIVVSGSVQGYARIGVLVRVNTDGSLDNTFGRLGTYPLATDLIGEDAFKFAIQKDGKIVVSIFSFYRGDTHDIMYRLNADGSSDIHNDTEYFFDMGVPAHSNFVAGQVNGKVVSGGVNLNVYNADGSFDSTFQGNGTPANFTDVGIDSNRLYAVVGNNTVVRYFLYNNKTSAPVVSLTEPVDNTTYLAPANFWLRAHATDADGAISKVEFYNGAKLLHTEYVAPYGYKWKNLPVGNYTITAKAYDHSGLVTTSVPVHISVVPNKPPTVSIIKPSNNQSFAAPGYLHLEADAKDIDGRISRVEFYNGTTLLRTEYEAPYTYHWQNVPVGIYTITAVAVDNWGAHTTSAPVTIKIKPATIVSNKPSSNDIDADGNALVTLKVSPNPTNTILNIYTRGLPQNKPATLSIITASGITVKTVQLNGVPRVVRLNVSDIASGVHTVKILCGNKFIYKQFVKL